MGLNAISFLSKIKPTRAFKKEEDPSSKNPSSSQPPQNEHSITKKPQEHTASGASSLSVKKPPSQQAEQRKQAPMKKKFQAKSKARRGNRNNRSNNRSNNNNNNNRSLPSMGHKGTEDVRKYQLNIEKLRHEPVQCDGEKAVAALKAYRERMEDLIGKGERKPDMQVYKALRSKWLPERPRHGHIKGVPPGLRLFGRGEAAILGIHCNILSGIDCYQGYPCYAVCLSGGYKDDKEEKDKSAVFYTGEGGQENGKQVNDQTETKGNVSLMESHKRGTPIRLITRDKGPAPFYTYEGIYRCTDCVYKKSQDGPRIYKFRLERIDD